MPLSLSLCLVVDDVNTTRVFFCAFPPTGQWKPITFEFLFFLWRTAELGSIFSVQILIAVTCSTSFFRHPLHLNDDSENCSCLFPKIKMTLFTSKTVRLPRGSTVILKNMVGYMAVLAMIKLLVQQKLGHSHYQKLDLSNKTTSLLLSIERLILLVDKSGYLEFLW